MPRMQTLNEAWNSEVEFTQTLARKPEWIMDLYDAVGFSLPDSFTTEAETQTQLGKRTDVLVMENGSPISVIECQDSTGSLDPVHASKITYYMSANGVDSGILICDNAPNEAKAYIREQNLHMPRDIAIVTVGFINKEPYFTAVETPLDRKTRKATQRSVQNSDYKAALDPWFAIIEQFDFIDPIAKSDMAASIRSPLSTKKWNPKENIVIVPVKSKCTIEMPAKYDPTSLFPQYEWTPHAGKNHNHVLKASVTDKEELKELLPQLHKVLYP